MAQFRTFSEALKAYNAKPPILKPEKELAGEGRPDLLAKFEKTVADYNELGYGLGIMKEQINSLGNSIGLKTDPNDIEKIEISDLVGPMVPDNNKGRALDRYNGMIEDFSEKADQLENKKTEAKSLLDSLLLKSNSPEELTEVHGFISGIKDSSLKDTLLNTHLVEKYKRRLAKTESDEGLTQENSSPNLTDSDTAKPSLDVPDTAISDVRIDTVSNPVEASQPEPETTGRIRTKYDEDIDIPSNNPVGKLNLTTPTNLATDDSNIKFGFGNASPDISDNAVKPSVAPISPTAERLDTPLPTESINAVPKTPPIDLQNNVQPPTTAEIAVGPNIVQQKPTEMVKFLPNGTRKAINQNPASEATQEIHSAQNLATERVKFDEKDPIEEIKGRISQTNNGSNFATEAPAPFLGSDIFAKQETVPQKPINDIPEPVVEAPKSVVETLKPADEISNPNIESPNNVVNPPETANEIVPLVAEAPKSVDDTVVPVAQNILPPVPAPASGETPKAGEANKSQEKSAEKVGVLGALGRFFKAKNKNGVTADIAFRLDQDTEKARAPEVETK